MRRDSDKFGNFYIHASSLNTFSDCEMRWASQNINQIGKKCEDEKASAGSNLKLVGAFFGTAGHLGLELMLEEKQQTGEWDFQRAYKHAVDRFEEDCEKAGNLLSWDRVTNKFDVAAEQLKRVLKVAAIQYVPKVTPVLIEQELQCDWNQHVDTEDTRLAGFILRGRTDGIMQEGDDVGCWIDDWKFGNKCGNYRGQVGAYKILTASNYDVDINGGRIIWIRRGGITIEQKKLIRINYDFDACINMATNGANRIAERVVEYEKTKDIEVFGKNPDSKFCTKKTCPAWGSSQCNAWIQETSEDQEEEAVLWAS